jgi:hypothetical protein
VKTEKQGLHLSRKDLELITNGRTLGGED